MLESSSEQLSSFIHWYFWCVNIGPLILYYVALGAFLYFSSCTIKINAAHSGFNQLFGWLSILQSILQLFTSSFGIIITFSATRWFSIEQTSRNSLKIVVRVLLYSWKHRYPERRSVFTYWENDIPSRLDLGKQKYGGPFTYEQVEDVKTMFKLLLLMVSLFGYHLSGDGYSLTHYIMSTMGGPMLYYHQ